MEAYYREDMYSWHNPMSDKMPHKHRIFKKDPHPDWPVEHIQPETEVTVNQIDDLQALLNSKATTYRRMFNGGAHSN